MKTMKVILITKEEVAYEVEIETECGTVDKMMDNHETIIWQDMHNPPKDKLFILNFNLTAKGKYKQAIYSESPIHYISGPIFEKKSN